MPGSSVNLWSSVASSAVLKRNGTAGPGKTELWLTASDLASCQAPETDGVTSRSPPKAARPISTMTRPRPVSRSSRRRQRCAAPGPAGCRGQYSAGLPGVVSPAVMSPDDSRTVYPLRYARSSFRGRRPTASGGDFTIE